LTKSTKRPREMSPSDRRSRTGVRVIVRAIDILSCFDETNEKLTLHAIADRTGIHKATAFRILSTLVDEKILDQSAPGDPYELGFFALRCADAILDASELRQRAVPFMLQLRDELNETVVLSERHGNCILNVDKVVSRQGIIEAPAIGVWKPLHESPAGLAVLSTFSENALEDYLTTAYSHRTPSQARMVRERVRHAKATLAAPTNIGSRNPILAAPITDSVGEAIAALSIAIPSGRAEPGLVRLCLMRLTWASEQLRPSENSCESAPGDTSGSGV